MSLLNNSPSWRYVQGTGVSVIHNNELHMVQDFYTDKKYIYWDLNTPNQFYATNVLPETSRSLYLIVINDEGDAQIVVNQDINVSFDGNSIEAIRDRINGIYDTNKEFGDRFVTVEQNINGITTTVGKLEESTNFAHEEISRIEQKADEIGLEVKDVTKEYGDDKAMNELRENFNSSIIKLNANLGIFNGELDEYFYDNEISVDERNSINIQLDVIKASKDKVVEISNKVLEIAKDIDKPQLSSSIQALENTHTNFNNSISSVISDNIITPTDRTLVINAFAQYNLKIMELKNTCDRIVFLGVGGVVTEELAKIGIKSNKISLEVSKKVDGNSIISAINMSPEQIQISSSKINITGLVTFNDLSTPGATTIHGGNIRSDTITADKIEGKHLYGVSVTTRDYGIRSVLTGDGINFYSDSTNAGKLSYDSNGLGTSWEARDRLWLRSLGGYALKIQSSGDMSISANEGYNKIWVKANTFNVDGRLTVNGQEISSVAVFG